MSDDRGEFLVAETAHLTGEYEASLAGYRFLWAHPLRPADSGGWRPIEVLLSPLASLVVRVLDGAGEPVA